MCDDDEEDAFEVLKATLADGGLAGFSGRFGLQGERADIELRQESEAFMAQRWDGTHLGTFAGLEAALTAIADALLDGGA